MSSSQMFMSVFANEQVFLLVLLRTVAFIGISPIFSVRAWPTWAKLGLAISVAILVMPEVHAHVPSAFAEPGRYVLVALRETATGLILGFIASMVFSAISIMGQLVDLQIGFSTGSFFDPALGQASGITASFQTILFTLYFLGLNGLDGLLLSCMNSYRFVPMGTLHFPPGFWQLLMNLFGLVMTLAVQLAAPLLAAFLLTDVTFALLSRAVPQMNIFVVGLPAKLFVGLILFAAIIPGIVYVFGRLFNMVFGQMQLVLQFLGR